MGLISPFFEFLILSDPLRNFQEEIVEICRMMVSLPGIKVYRYPAGIRITLLE